ncbi:transposase [Ligilactobacillus equi]|uniref:transposase n=1 Tax=Ligilactobacillus equi TaxID=137357 RepID=UPI0039BC7F59
MLNTYSKEYQQFNNGGIEGINRRIKLTEREGFGITNLDHLRKRLILQINYHVERKKESKKIK